MKAINDFAVARSVNFKKTDIQHALKGIFKKWAKLCIITCRLNSVQILLKIFL
jgi:hypothetical protein